MQCAWGWGNRKEKKKKEKEKEKGKEKAGLTGKGEGCHPQGSGNNGVTPLSSPPLSEIRPKENKHTCSLRTPGATWGPNHNTQGEKGTEVTDVVGEGGGARRGQGPGPQGALETGWGYRLGTDTWHNVLSHFPTALEQGCASERTHPEPSSSPSPANTGKETGNAS